MNRLIPAAEFEDYVAQLWRKHEKEVQEAPGKVMEQPTNQEWAKEERSALLLSAKGKLPADEWETVRVFWTTDPSQFTPESVTEACK